MLCCHCRVALPPFAHSLLPRPTPPCTELGLLRAQALASLLIMVPGSKPDPRERSLHPASGCSGGRGEGGGHGQGHAGATAAPSRSRGRSCFRQTESGLRDAASTWHRATDARREHNTRRPGRPCVSFCSLSVSLPGRMASPPSRVPSGGGRTHARTPDPGCCAERIVAAGAPAPSSCPLLMSAATRGPGLGPPRPQRFPCGFVGSRSQPWGHTLCSFLFYFFKSAPLG